MLRLGQGLICYTILLIVVFALAEARPQNNAVNDNTQDLENIEPEIEEVRNAYYDLPSQSVYPSIPLDRLQMLVAQYRPNAYIRSSAWNNMNGLYRLPETKRQVRYRQCYFNPISCFKK